MEILGKREPFTPLSMPSRVEDQIDPVPRSASVLGNGGVGSSFTCILACIDGRGRNRVSLSGGVGRTGFSGGGCAVRILCVVLLALGAARWWW
jgi:hypothetical protein